MSNAEFAYVVPIEKYVYRAGNKWRLDQPLGPKGIRAHLRSRGLSGGEIKYSLDNEEHLIVHGFDIAPGEGELFKDPADDLVYINTWVAPRLTPEPGEWPSIKRVLMHLVNHDPEGYNWLIHWLALKIQNPAVLPKVAPVFSTKPGAGKGTLARVKQEMLGEKNCETINRENLESRFNTAWVGKLFVHADEVTSSGENMKDIKEKMKQYIDSPRVPVEGKGKDARTAPNHASWIISSNDRVAPVIIEPGDRRYTIFVNHNDASKIKALCDSLYLGDDRYTLQPFFEKEIRGFWDYLLKLKVNRDLISRPHENDDRQEMIESSLGSQEAFIRHVQAEGIAGCLERLRKNGELAVLDENEWRFEIFDEATKTVVPGRLGVASTVLYRCYQDYCRQYGQHAVRMTRFGVAIKSVWPKYRPEIESKGEKKRVWAYQVPLSGP